MKIKLISLIAALLCFTMLLISCGEQCTNHTDADKNGVCDTCEDTIEWPKSSCTDHKDENGDGVCDTEDCDVVIQIKEVEVEVEVEVEIPVKNPLEEKVDMIVKPLPETNNVSEYFTFDHETNTITLYVSPVTAVKSAEVHSWMSSTRYIVKKTEKVSDAVVDNPETTDVDETAAAVFKDTYSLFDVIANKEIINLSAEYKEGTAPAFLANRTAGVITFTLGEDAYFYTTSGEAITSAKVATANIGIDSASTFTTYLTVDKVVYAVDTLSSKLIKTERADLLVKRPNFTALNEAYGYIFDGDKYQVFDATKWVSLVWEYETPKNAVNNSFITLADGKIVHQYYVALPYNAVNYDFENNDGKFDLVHVVIDLAAKTATPVEFGYLISASTFAADFRTDKAENVVNLVAIKDGKLQTSVIAVLNNNLDILCVYDRAVMGAGSASHTLVADNRFITTITLGDVPVRALVNELGEVLMYLPANYDVCDGYAILNNSYDVIYNIEPSAEGALTVKFDFAQAEFDVVKHNGSVFLLTKEVNTAAPEAEPVLETKFYIYNVSKDEAPVEIPEIEAFSWYQDNNVFATSTIVNVPVDESNPDAGTTPVVKYQVRDYNNNVLLTLDSVTYMEIPDLCPPIAVNVLDDGNYEVKVYTGYDLSAYVSYYLTVTAPAPVEPAPVEPAPAA